MTSSACFQPTRTHFYSAASSPLARYSQRDSSTPQREEGRAGERQMERERDVKIEEGKEKESMDPGTNE